MPEGGCLCGRVRFSYTGEPAVKALCHCTDCRKITGSVFSTNLAIPHDNFKLLSGTPKTFTLKGSTSGKDFTSYFCGDCGSTLWREGDGFAGVKAVKVGTMDDIEALNEAKPQVELFAGRRVDWIPQVSGATDLQGMS